MHDPVLQAIQSQTAATDRQTAVLERLEKILVADLVTRDDLHAAAASIVETLTAEIQKGRETDAEIANLKNKLHTSGDTLEKAVASNSPGTPGQ